MNIILASTSKIRQAILANAGVTFTVLDAAIDESSVKLRLQGDDARRIAMELAKQKSEKISREFPQGLVIGADQTLGFQNEIFSKPISKAEARNQLLKLKGNIHTLYSAISCSSAGKETWTYCAEANLTMRNFSDQFLDDYLNSEQISYTSSVGGYKLEEVGIQLFDRIDGDYFGILGLPILPLLEFLRSKNLIQS